MFRAAAALALLAFGAMSAAGQTFNVWERGYITCPVHGIVDKADSLDITPPIIAGDTLNTRGFMIGLRSTMAVGLGYGISIRYRQAGDDGWERWDQWLNGAGASNLGMPLIGDWQPSGSTWEMALTDFMPLANVRLLRLLNPSTNASMQTVTIWFLDQQDARAADWSAWTMP